MKIEIRKPNYRYFEVLIAFSFLVPYLEVSLARDLLEYNKNGVVIPAIIFVMIGIICILKTIMVLYGKRAYASKIKFIEYLMVVLGLLILIRGVYLSDFFAFFAQFLWFITPFYYALTIIRFIDIFKMNLVNILKIGVIYFNIYLLFNIGINIQKYGFSLLGAENQTRLISPGGGPVILGYTIVLAMCCVLFLRKEFSIINVLLIIITLLVGAILTGSRGAIWPILFLILIYIVTNKNLIVRYINMFILLLIIVSINPLSFISNYVPRILNLEGGARAETLTQSLNILMEQPIFNIFFGAGLSGFFPYQLWISNISTPLNFWNYNIFYYNEHALLVQPHNTFLYLIIETGLLGGGLFITIFVFLFYLILRQKCRNKIFKYLFLLFIVLLNCLDSVFIIQPGSAGLWWLMLFMITFSEEDRWKGKTSITIGNKKEVC